MYYLIDIETHPFAKEVISNWTYFWLRKDIKELYCKKEELNHEREIIKINRRYEAYKEELDKVRKERKSSN